jgi:hypothetical protein
MEQRVAQPWQETRSNKCRGSGVAGIPEEVSLYFPYIRLFSIYKTHEEPHRDFTQT